MYIFLIGGALFLQSNCGSSETTDLLIITNLIKTNCRFYNPPRHLVNNLNLLNNCQSKYLYSFSLL